jgi:LysR family transcriptional regulator, flagellar master operon regulator
VDIEILKTFQEVAKTRHFARAAENLFVTQAAVSARVSQLENRLGVRLFTRQRNNIQLTSEGHRLAPYVETITTTWSRAITEISGDENVQLIALGCLPSISEIFLDRLLSNLHSAGSDKLLQVEQLSSASLVTRTREQSLHVGLLYEPPVSKDLTSEQIAEIELILVSSQADLSIADELHNYVYVDWGTTFGITHNKTFATPPKVITRVDTPRPAKSFIENHGGCAYLARRQVAAELANGELYLVRQAPVINRPVYVICSNAYFADGHLEEVMNILADLDHS